MSGVVNKESGKEKGSFPHTPFKVKESPKETLPVSDSVSRARACEAGEKAEAEAVNASGLKRGILGVTRLTTTLTEAILSGFREDGTRNDPVQIAMLALGIPERSGRRPNGKPYTNAGIIRWMIPQVGGEDAFRYLVYQQWRENCIDRDPDSRAATFMAKLYKERDNLKKGGAA